jgi:hypothetical protein
VKAIAGFLPEIWLPDVERERRRRLVARRNQIVRPRTTRVKNETHAILAAHLIRHAHTPSCSTGRGGLGWRAAGVARRRPHRDCAAPALARPPR